MKPAVGRFIILLPVILAVVSFILSMLALFAGRQPGFMEDYAVIRLNTSMVGHTFFQNNKKEGKDGDKKKEGGGLLDGIIPGVSIPGISIPGDGILGDAKDAITDAVKDKLNDVAGSIVGKIAEKIGIKEFYSLHVMNFCEGYFQPNSTSPNVALNVTKCTSSDPAHRLNFTALLDKELKVGPAKLNLADINWPEGIQDALDVLNTALLGLLIIYALGASFCAVSAIGGLASFFKPDLRLLSLMNFAIAGPGFLALITASILVTVATNAGVDVINGIGSLVGLEASRGKKFLALSWVSAVFMGLVTLFWIVRFWMIRFIQKRLKMFTREKP